MNATSPFLVLVLAPAGLYAQPRTVFQSEAPVTSPQTASVSGAYYTTAAGSQPAKTADAGTMPQRAAPASTNADAAGELKVTVVPTSSAGINTTLETRLGGNITVAIDGLHAWSRVKGNDPRLLRLYLAGNLLEHVEPTLLNVDQEYLNFVLRPEVSDKKERTRWFGILEEARRHEDGSIPISVGPMNQLQPFTSEQFIRLKIYPGYTAGVVVLLVILLFALVVLGKRSQLLRDGPDLTSTYSLGRVQMAWWFYLVVAAYLYLWLITGQVNMLTPSVLALIGISAATGLSAVFVSSRKSLRRRPLLQKAPDLSIS